MAAAVETEITPYVLNHFIAGKTVKPGSGDYLDKLDPRSGERIARVASGNEADVDAAVQAASAAFPEWRDRRPMDRAKVMLEMARAIRKHVKLLAEIESRENGTPAAQTPAGLETAAGFCTGWRHRIVVSRNFIGGKQWRKWTCPTSISRAASSS